MLVNIKFIFTCFKIDKTISTKTVMFLLVYIWKYIIFLNNCFGNYLQMYIGNTWCLDRRHVHSANKYLVGSTRYTIQLEILKSFLSDYINFDLCLVYYVPKVWFFFHLYLSHALFSCPELIIKGDLYKQYAYIVLTVIRTIIAKILISYFIYVYNTQVIFYIYHTRQKS